jgi:hypothetical protein
VNESNGNHRFMGLYPQHSYSGEVDISDKVFTVVGQFMFLEMPDEANQENMKISRILALSDGSIKVSISPSQFHTAPRFEARYCLERDPKFDSLGPNMDFIKRNSYGILNK